MTHHGRLRQFLVNTTLRLDVRFLARLFGQDKPNLTDKKMNGNFTSIGGKAGVM